MCLQKESQEVEGLLRIWVLRPNLPANDYYPPDIIMCKNGVVVCPVVGAVGY